ncbi:MAG: peroxidase [Elusimicrobia bacterium]|nr:MAG: peroxidase [Elusimicrobiota bacterium]KAF0154010.1 MAG: peroxidase [Elusimicrobiota bacterium]
MAWIEVIEPERAEGKLKEIYDETLRSRGALAAVHKIHSLHPESLTAHMALYMTLLYGKSPLLRRERELIAVAVSRANGCPYCIGHHSDAFARYEKDPAKVQAARDGRWEEFAANEAALCRYADKLTRAPSACSEADVAALRAAGYGDQAVLDAAQIAAYFNFVNRLVLCLGVHLEGEAERQGFKY